MNGPVFFNIEPSILPTESCKGEELLSGSDPDKYLFLN